MRALQCGICLRTAARTTRGREPLSVSFVSTGGRCAHRLEGGAIAFQIDARGERGPLASAVSSNSSQSPPSPNQFYHSLRLQRSSKRGRLTDNCGTMRQKLLLPAKAGVERGSPWRKKIHLTVAPHLTQATGRPVFTGWTV